MCQYVLSILSLIIFAGGGGLLSLEKFQLETRVQNVFYFYGPHYADSDGVIQETLRYFKGKARQLETGYRCG